MDEVFELVAAEGAGRADAWLAALLPLSRSRIQGLIRDGHVTIDGRAVRPSHRLAGGERVRVEVPPPAPGDLVAQDLGIPLLYVDEHVIVVDKPAGVVVHPSRGHADGTLVNALLHLLEEHRAAQEDESDGSPDPARPGIVHRLDAGTSGVLVVARTPASQAALSAQLAARSVERRYLALVWGTMTGERGTIDAPLGRHPTDRLRFAVQPGGRRAVTHWEARGAGACAGLRRPRPLTLVECRLETGRTHQIRVHLAHVGHPIAGDPVYGGARRLPPSLRPVDHQLLHAFRLGFTHPSSGEWMRFESPLPADFRAVLAAVGIPAP